MSTRDSRSRQQTRRDILEGLRDLRAHLALLNHNVSARVAVKDVDLECLDLLTRRGPLSPTALARDAGLHPATMTGILDRLERAGWVTRDRDAGDRRGVVVRPVPDRQAEMLRLYSGMTGALNRICASYDDDQLEVIADFLRRASAAGRQAAERISRS